MRAPTKPQNRRNGSNSWRNIIDRHYDRRNAADRVPVYFAGIAALERRAFPLPLYLGEFCGRGVALARSSHVSIDSLVTRLSASVRRKLETVVVILVTTFSLSWCTRE